MWGQIKKRIPNLRSACRMPRAAYTAALDLLFPRQVKCALCDIELGEDFPFNLCPDCTEGLLPIGTGGCRICGRLVGAFTWQGLCPHCQTGREWLHAGCSAFAYGDAAQAIIHGLKYHRKPWLAHSMAAQMAPGVRNLCARQGFTALVPVPVHRERLQERGYNQAELLARELSALPGIPPTVTALERIRATEAQNQLSRQERLRNVTGAFAPGREALRIGVPARALLIDDVLTTGSTLNACARVLTENGSSCIGAATYASVSG